MTDVLGDICADSPGDPDEFPQEGLLDSLSVGTLVRHRQNPELIGRIVSIDTTTAKIQLLAFPTTWWRVWWSDRPAPVLVDNLELAE